MERNSGSVPPVVQAGDPLRASPLPVSQVIALARAAGAAIEAVRQASAGDLALHDKSDGSPLSPADIAAHMLIVPALQALTPAWPVYSEEGQAAPPDAPLAGAFWLVDPLDGTREFLAGRPEYTVNIALVQDRVPRFGVVLVPRAGTLYWGGAGLGAWSEHPGQAPQPLRVAAAPAAGETWRVVASRSHLDPATAAFIARLGRSECLAVGSSLKFCRVAEGAAHVYPRLGPTHEWDTAAAHAVLAAAGGYVNDLQGLPLRYGRPGIPNPAFVAGCMAFTPA